MTDAAALAGAVSAARTRLIEFVERCSDDQWTSRPLTDDPRAVGVIVDHVADAYEYLGAFVTKLIDGQAVEVSPEIVDDLNARHASTVDVPTQEAAVDHLLHSGDRFVAAIKPLSPEQLGSGEGRVTVRRFAEIAARHADDHRGALETALGLA